ncbi:ABC transporter substrate-binding protein [Caballeronia sp. LjRoot34]|uniref:ABC transporter substrate-binding protein n=1 Tax=Caballeronia sp. LjRoot34 TaxID=3342325 RepID=UPI003ECFC862
MTQPTRPTVRTLLLAAACAAALLGAAPGVSAQTVTAVMQSSLRVLDPVMTTAHATRDFGYMIFDTVLALDANGQVKPQMAEKWTVSPDGKTYTFTLRPGLKWHDGTKVTAADCVASIKRWAEQDKLGQLMIPLMTEMKAIDDNTFSMSFKEPTDLALQALSKPSGSPAFMMPARIAATPSTTPLKEFIGSGPFKFVAAEYKPGLQAVFEKNKDYVPRNEPPSGLAGGKKVYVDRVKWIAMPDSMTGVNALTSGEIDYMQTVPFEMVPMLEGNNAVKVENLSPENTQTVMRFNFLNPPFDNKLIRQAAMIAVKQEDVLKALVGNPKYYTRCVAIFGCNGLYASNAGADIAATGNLAQARALLKQAHYDGTPVVILQTTDVANLSPQPVVIGQALKNAGFNVKMEAMDWQTVVSRRASQAPIDKGGWSIFSTNNDGVEVRDPLTAFGVAANGKRAWFGWPDVPAIETLRGDFIKTTDQARRKQITDQIQKLVIDEGVLVPLGEYYMPSAYSKKLSGIVKSPVPLFWNLKKGT